MKIIRVEQGSPDWHTARAGVITASMFRVARERLSKGAKAGEPTEKAKNYAFRLAIERISGESLDDGAFDTWQMKRGRELEPEARARHAFLLGVDINDGGFVLSDCGRFGASADGLIADDGGAEYKCLISPDSLRDVYFSGDISDYIDQVQGGMWLTGRKYWDLCIYCPPLAVIGRDMWRRRIVRDDDYIAALVIDLAAFNRLVEDYKKQLEADQ